MPVPLVRTPREIGDQAADKFGPETGRPVLTLAPIMSAALYAPDEPDEDTVTRAWDLESELRSILDAKKPLVARVLFWIDPRPLLRTKPFRTKPFRTKPSRTKRSRSKPSSGGT